MTENNGVHENALLPVQDPAGRHEWLLSTSITVRVASRRRYSAS
jgi:hypothetical protein